MQVKKVELCNKIGFIRIKLLLQSKQKKRPTYVLHIASTSETIRNIENVLVLKIMRAKYQKVLDRITASYHLNHSV